MNLLPGIISIIVLLYFYFGFVNCKKILKSNRLGNTSKRLNMVMVWLVPFIWYWLIKGFLEPTEVMTKDKRKIDKSNFRESGIGQDTD